MTQPVSKIPYSLPKTSAGFSLPELLVIVAILGVIAAVGIPAFFFVVRRARVQSVALEVAGWIENVRNAAADEVSEDPSLGGCVITFTPDLNMAARADLASADCAVPESELLVPDTVQQEFVTIDIIAGPDEITFTPRGLWTGPGNTPGADFRMLITLDSGGPSRCVRLSPILGSVEIGRPDCGNGSNWQLL